jgi:hypothetical protein
MTAFKAGDKVRIARSSQSDCENLIGQTGTLIGGEGNFCIVFDGEPSGTWTFDKYEGHTGKRGWYVDAADLERVTPSLATALSLHKGDRTILAHLEAGKPITPMKALVVYGYSRLASHIHRLRNAGYNIASTSLTDEAGHKYASYSLVTQ